MILDLTDMTQSRQNSNQSSEEKSVTEIQKFFLQKMFFEPMAESSKELAGDTEDDEDAVGGFGSEKEMNITMMNRVLAQRLSEKDFLGLKKRYIHGNNDRIAALELSAAYPVAPYRLGKLSD